MTRERMFDLVEKTWNPVVGCEHDCSYCWCRYMVATKLRNVPRYREGFKPQLIEKELRRRFRDGRLVFVSDMGDLMGRWVPDDWILKVFDAIRQSPDAQFLLLTKNPVRYYQFLSRLPENTVLGATIESNRDYGLTHAPLPETRYRAMASLRCAQPRMVSVEPIMDFDESVFLRWLREIDPDFVYVGYDNWKRGLQEPTREKTERLIRGLEEFTHVRKKTIREAAIL